MQLRLRASQTFRGLLAALLLPCRFCSDGGAPLDYLLVILFCFRCLLARIVKFNDCGACASQIGDFQKTWLIASHTHWSHRLIKKKDSQDTQLSLLHEIASAHSDSEALMQSMCSERAAATSETSWRLETAARIRAVHAKRDIALCQCSLCWCKKRGRHMKKKRTK